MNYTGGPVLLLSTLPDPNMLLRPLALAAAALTFATLTQAQTLDDALRYSENFPLGTARSLGVSNSMSALGADYSAVSSNPAGLAAFRRNDFSLTLGSLTTGSNGSSLDGGPTAENNGNTRFALPQAGLVLTRRPIASKWTQAKLRGRSVAVESLRGAAELPRDQCWVDYRCVAG